MLRTSITLAALYAALHSIAQRPTEPRELALDELVRQGWSAADLQDLQVADSYSDEDGTRHTWLRQRWQGIEIFNSEVAVHQKPDGSLLKLNTTLYRGLERVVNGTAPGMAPEAALGMVLQREGLDASGVRPLDSDAARKLHRFSATGTNDEPLTVQLVYVAQGDRLVLGWNVNFSLQDGSHWWNIRVDATSGVELERNDWTVHCAFDHPDIADHAHDAPMAAPAPLAPNDYNVYAMPLESPNYGARTLQNAPWNAALNASPYGWHDTNGAAGPEHTITRGNNVWAQEDVNGNNGTGYSPTSATLDFDFPVDLTQAPSVYQDAAITNLFYWNNIIHDVLYQYGFTSVAGNFQSNTYSLGGVGNDWVNADAQDGSGTNNANFSTPADGSQPRMQMFLWTAPTPDRDGDFDNGIIAHEYGHGVSNRLVGGPSNVNCLGNAEQMGEGWSDYFGLMLSMETGDARNDNRGIGTYALNQPPTGVGIRPAPYTCNFAVNGYTYASTNNSSLSQPHGIGFVWCTMLWEMTWDLVDSFGFSPNFYNGAGTAGNQIALRLVMEGLKLTACNPGFVDGRDAILAADVNLYGGAHTNIIWAAFARRGLGYSASQGSTSSRSDQVEAFNLPVNNSVGVLSALAPAAGSFFECANGQPVSLTVRNSGLLAQSTFTVNYRLDGGPVVSQPYAGSLNANTTATFTFPAPLTISGYGTHTLKAWTALTGDQYVADDTLNWTVNYQPATEPDFVENCEGAVAVPAGWALQNPDNSFTWTNVSVTNGSGCATTRAWMIDHYTYNAPGQEDRLISPLIDLAGSSGTRLKFHHAYAQYSAAYIDGFKVDLSTNCGGSWTNLYNVSGAALATAPATTSTYAPANCSQWLAHDIDLSAYDGQKVVLRFVAVNGFGNRFYLDNVVVQNNGVKLALKLFLEGPYDQALNRMADSLRVDGLVPNSEPYTAAGFTQASDGGGETAQPGVLAQTGDNAVVDWVQVEIRDNDTLTTVLATRPALLQRDGDVVAVNNLSPISVLRPAGTYHVAVLHRNHLGCMTAVPVALNTSTPTTIDLTQATTATYGTGARKSIGAIMTLYAGNARIDSLLKYTGLDNDRDPVLTAIGGVVPTNAVNGYLVEDLNMDGQVKYTGAGNDRDLILQNIGGIVPTAVRIEQLP